MSRTFNDPEDSFAYRTVRRGECLIWTGVIVGRGYGRMSVHGKITQAHRYAWERVNGPIPEGLVVDHRMHCDKACVEVRHLRLATRSENSSNRSGPESANKSTGVRNVYPNKKGYCVKLRHHGKSYHFGTYPTIKEAAEVAQMKRKSMFGDYAGRG